MTARTAGIAFALMLGATSLYAAETRNFDRTLPLSASGTVEIDAHNGTIQLRTWDRPDVEVHVRIEAGGDSPAARSRLRESTVDIDGSSNLVSIKWRNDWSGPWSWSWFGWDIAPEVTYSITAPRTASVRIRNHNAKVEIRDLSGPLDLATHNGYSHIEFASFTHASRITSHNGGAELVLPASSKLEIRSTGHRMHLQSDFPVTMQASDFGRHRFDGKVSGGGPELRIESHNGSFRLRSK